MREPDEKNLALAALREAIATRDASLVRLGLNTLAKAGDGRSATKVTPPEAVDLLERSCAYGPSDRDDSEFLPRDIQEELIQNIKSHNLNVKNMTVLRNYSMFLFKLISRKRARPCTT